jgi:hypothetical protein
VVFRIAPPPKNERVTEGPSDRVKRILSRFSDEIDQPDREWLEGRLRYAHEPTLQQRISELLQDLPLGVTKKAINSFAERCQKRRNQISHIGGPPDTESRQAFHEDLMKLTNASRHLFHAILLREIGLDQYFLGQAMSETPYARLRIQPALKRVRLLKTVSSTTAPRPSVLTN